MKFIHCADIHLGSKMEAKLPKEKVQERRKEVADTFKRMVEFAKQESVTAILLSGDVFDTDRPFKKDKDLFYDVIKGAKEIDFLYLRGNHDGEESYEEELPNLKLFSEKWTQYAYGNVCVSGIELSGNNASSLYNTLQLEKSAVNLVMMHGQESSAVGVNEICIKKLADKNIDYLALGHIHSYAEKKLDNRGRYAYSGCLEGRGFDDCGEKGFVLLEIEKEVKSSFVPFAQRTIYECKVDLTGTESAELAMEKVSKQVKFDKKHLYRVELKGEISYDNDGLDERVKNYFESQCYFLDVKDTTLKKINAEEYAYDVSLRGEFVRSVMENSEYTDEEKSKIIAVGLKALLGREVV